MKMEPIEGFETSAFGTQTPGNNPKENILHNLSCLAIYPLKRDNEFFPSPFFVPALCRGVRHWNNRRVSKWNIFWAIIQFYIMLYSLWCELRSFPSSIMPYLYCSSAPLHSLISLSSCSWRVRRVSCSLILKMKLVPPSLPRSSYVPSSIWLILWCLFGYSICVHFLI